MQAATFVAALIGILTCGVAQPTAAQQQPGPAPVTRTDLIKRALPPGNFREVQAVVVELAAGAAAPRHRHDVAVLAYVLEGIVENQFDGGPPVTHREGDSWWEAPGTVHDVARNASKTARARLLIVYIGEEGKSTTVRIGQSSPPADRVVANSPW
jgi:quercetin dioxygenase-like cupin family protein